MLQIIKSSKNLQSSINVTESNEIGIVSSSVNNFKDKIVKSLAFKNLNIAARYLTPKAKLTFIQLKKAFTKALILQKFDPNIISGLKLTF